MSAPSARDRPPLDHPPGSDDRVAVVLPCYRQAHFLAEALESLSVQSHPPSEVVVVDDGSPDDVAGAASAFPEVRLVRQENAGLAAARNRGLAECTAPFVVFLDSDDRLLPDALATNVAALLEQPLAAFSWGFNRPFADDGRRLDWGPTSFEGTPSYSRLLETNVVGAPVGVMFRAGLVRDVGGFSVSLSACEDYELYLRLAREHPFVCVHTVIAEYRHHGENMSGDLRRMFESLEQVLAAQDDRVTGNPELEAARARGLRDARLRYDLPDRLGAVRTLWGDGRRLAALLEVGDLWRRYPTTLPGRLGRRILSRG